MAFFKFRSRGQKGDEPSAGPTETIEGMRRRAKHRLIGAAILVLLGVIGFPLLFDSQPRTLPVDIAIDIPDKGKAKPIGIGAAGSVVKLEKSAETSESTPPTTPSSGGNATAQAGAPSGAKPNASVPASASLDAKEEMVATKQTPVPPSRPEKPAPTKPEPHPEPKPEPKPVAVAKVDESGARAKALLEGKDTAPAAAAAGEARFIVQVGAFSDAGKAREARLKVERAGLKTYTQEVQTKEGARIRVRVGPYGMRAEADKVADRIKALSLPASVLTL